MKNKNKIVTIMLVLAFCGAIASTVYSVLTYGRAHITSDSASAYLLTKSIIDSGSLFPKGWNYCNREIWFCNAEMMSFPFVALMKNMPLARMFGSLLALAITCCGVAFATRRLFQNRSYLISIPIFLVFIGGEIAKDNDLYQVAYPFRFLWVCVCPVLLYDIFLRKDVLKKKQYIAEVVLFAVLMLGLMIRGERYIAEQMMPLLFTVGWILCNEVKSGKPLKGNSQLKKGAFACGITVLASAVGYAINTVLNYYRNTNGSSTNATTFADSVAGLHDNITATIYNAYNNFGYIGHVGAASGEGIKNLISLVMCTIAFFVVPILAYKNYKSENNGTKFYLIYSVCHNAIMLLIIILFSKTREPWMLSVIFVNVIVTSNYIYEHWIDNKMIFRYLWAGLFLIATGIASFSLVKSGAGWKEALDNQKNVADVLIEHGLKKGYASFWNAYSTEVYSDGRLEFAEAHIEDDKIFSWYWLVDSSRYEDSKQPTFLMLDEEENEVFSSCIEPTFGAPVDVFAIEDAYCYDEFSEGDGYVYKNKYIYVFDYDITVNLRNGIHDGVLTSNELFSNYEGTLARGQKFVTSKGEIVQGPYSDIDEGIYLVTYVGKNLDKADYEMMLGEGEEDCATISELSRDSKEVKFSLKVSKRVEALDLRMINNSDDTIELENIRVQRQ